MTKYDKEVHNIERALGLLKVPLHHQHEIFIGVGRFRILGGWGGGGGGGGGGPRLRILGGGQGGAKFSAGT